MTKKSANFAIKGSLTEEEQARLVPLELNCRTTTQRCNNCAGAHVKHEYFIVSILPGYTNRRFLKPYSFGKSRGIPNLPKTQTQVFEPEPMPFCVDCFEELKTRESIPPKIFASEKRWAEAVASEAKRIGAENRINSAAAPRKSEKQKKAEILFTSLDQHLSKRKKEKVGS